MLLLLTLIKMATPTEELNQDTEFKCEVLRLQTGFYDRPKKVFKWGKLQEITNLDLLCEKDMALTNLGFYDLNFL